MLKWMRSLDVDLHQTSPLLSSKNFFPSSWQLFSTSLVGISFDGFSLAILSLLPATPPADRCRLLDFKFKIGAVHVDVTQDLLILQYNSELYVRSLTDGSVHRSFNSPIDFICLPSCMLVTGNNRISVWGDWILVSGHRVIAVVGEWTTVLIHWPTSSIVHVSLPAVILNRAVLTKTSDMDVESGNMPGLHCARACPAANRLRGRNTMDSSLCYSSNSGGKTASCCYASASCTAFVVFCWHFYWPSSSMRRAL